MPGIRYVMDADRSISAAYGACGTQSADYDPYVAVLDRQLRVAGRFAPSHAADAVALVEQLLDERAPDDWAPVLLVPRVLERATCRDLIRLYDSGGGEDSGFMREVEGKTVSIIDHNHKRRSDLTIRNPEMCRALSARVNRCLRPAISRAFNFDATRMERYIVACYDAAVGGHFRPHRDNTTKGTAHRRFAVTINLNDEFDGGELRFPEFGMRTYRAPPGGAIVFGCGLLHEATQVTKGRRYAFLPFLYDDAAAAERAANNVHLGDGVSPIGNSAGIVQSSIEIFTFCALIPARAAMLSRAAWIMILSRCGLARPSGISLPCQPVKARPSISPRGNAVTAAPIRSISGMPSALAKADKLL